MNQRREVPKYRPPAGNNVAGPAPKPKPLAIEGPTSPPVASKPRREPSADGAETVSTRLDPPRMAKLDRLRARVGGLVLATRSATLRWLLDQFEE